MLILADASIWIDYFRFGNQELSRRLHQAEIVIHPFVIAELALGSLKHRVSTLALLDFLPQAPVAQMYEVRKMIESRQFYSLGIGLIDAHLIASVFLNPTMRLWTRDKRLRYAAERLGIQADLP